MTVQITPIINQLLEDALPHVPPSVLIEYIEMTVKHMKLLNRESPRRATYTQILKGIVTDCSLRSAQSFLLWGMIRAP